ncbi:MAG TPA: ORC1-type DNA replication protein [archaeon]|nr:ORC1-type DNA replication protein [archaeon]
MKQQTLQDIFSNYVQASTSIFKSKDVLSPDFIPEITIHRDEQIKQLASILSPSLRGLKVSNIFLFGKTGTGKTVCAKQVTSELVKSSNKIKVVYLNCKMKRVSDTEYRVLAELSRSFGKTVPPTGLPTDEIYRIFYSCVEAENKNIILILDEIDALVKKIGDELLYNLTRINQDLKNSKISIIGISNDTTFTENLDPRVKSSLSEEEILFPPYNASQLKDILDQRADYAISTGCVEPGVITKCAALAAQEHGDARKALDLLRIAAETAERDDAQKILVKHVDKAEEKLDLDRTVEIVKTQPKQSLAVLTSIVKLVELGRKNIQTGDIFEIYQQISTNTGLKNLTQRRVSDLIGELDMLGIINTRVISKGRYGRTREIRLLLGKQIIEKIKKVLADNYLL